MVHYLLAIETSSSQGSLAIMGLYGEKKAFKKENPVFQSFKLLSKSVWNTEEGFLHSERITLQLEDCLKKANLELENLNYLAASTGPGSFTGLRVGVNVIRTLAFSLDIPIFSVHSLRVLAQNLNVEKNLREMRILTLRRAYGREYFGAFFKKRGDQIKELLPPTLLDERGLLEKLRLLFEIDLRGDLRSDYDKNLSLFCLGEGFFEMSQKEPFLSAKKIFIRDKKFSDYPLASRLGEIVFQNFNLEQSLDWRALKPLYIRASSAEEKLEKKK